MEATPTVEEALAYANGYSEGLRDAKEQDVAALIENLDIATANLAFEKALRAGLHAEIASLRAENARLKARLEEAGKVIEPFADISDLVDAETEGLGDSDEFELLFADYLLAKFPLSAFRAARRFAEGAK